MTRAIGLAVLALALGAPASAQFSVNTARRSAVWVVTPTATGAGFLLDRQSGLVMTAYHVVQGRPSIRVVFPVYRGGQVLRDRDWYRQRRSWLGVPGRLVRFSKERDLALIRLDDPSRVPFQAVPVRLARTEPRPGNRVHLISGVPRGRRTAFEHVSGVVQRIRWHTGISRNGNTTTPYARRAILSTVPGLPGNSGAAVVSNRGEVVGVHVAEVQVSGVAVSVAITEVWPFILPAVGTEPAGSRSRAAFVSRSGVGYWLAPVSGRITRPEQNTWQRSSTGRSFTATVGSGLWIPGGNVRDPKANTWGPSTRWLPGSGNGFWFTPYAGPPSEPRAARWAQPSPSGPWVSLRGPGLWSPSATGPARPQLNTWRPIRPGGTR